MAKSEFGLESAAWSALLVDADGVIRNANPVAMAIFPLAGRGKETKLATIWGPDNPWAVETFLESEDGSFPESLWINFRLRVGSHGRFRILVCPMVRQNQHFLLIQALFEPAPEAPAAAPVAAPASSPAAVPKGLLVSPGVELSHDASDHRNGFDRPRPALVEAKIVASPSPFTVPVITVPELGAVSVDNDVAQKQKLDCAMQLIRSVVLDFNNSLTCILGHTSLILGKMESDNPWRASLLEVEKSAEKAAEIASDLATFSLQENDARSLVTGNLNELIRRTLAVFQSQKNSTIAWTTELEKKLLGASFDEAKMQQALVKVIENAIQAVSENAHIAIRTRNLQQSEPWRDGNAILPPGNYVCCEIVDDGSGIQPKVMPRIFEPFFTTKTNHRGLGLAWVYGIVTNHGGQVAVSSHPGQGTTVRIYLPALKRIVKDRTLDLGDLGGHETILMVDDEDLLLTMGQTVLSTFGYKVLTANSGPKALEIVSQTKEKIDLVITDLVMPNMSGRELIERLRHQAPTLRILCTSGYVRPHNAEESDNYLRKPFTSQDLLRKVQQILAN